MNDPLSRAYTLAKLILPPELQGGGGQVQGQYFDYQLGAYGGVIFYKKDSKFTDRLGEGCVQLTSMKTEYNYPPMDRLIAFYLLIKGDELYFLQHINVSWVKPVVFPPELQRRHIRMAARRVFMTMSATVTTLLTITGILGFVGALLVFIHKH